ncbi:serine/threonine protein kinase (plasmid) [Mycolicibacterium frederiksbergense]|uniref:non-specific serine/threonine protein kinase n=2 Tax=Mycolicibacterium frederiksbergense TaxID=117567 RepID=A0A6H0RYL2_9MYCO|nr:serine/threonine protein kinase [Mycolicibacterium frederiksbergense]
MSVVYLAWHPTRGHWAALKVLTAERARSPAFRARFRREGETTAGLGHPNVVALYGRGETADGQRWIAMQYIEGPNAETAVPAGPMAPERALRIVSEVAGVLDYAHRYGVVHQDVKPSNILLGTRADGRERVVLADFGSAALLSTTTTEESDDAEDSLVASFAYTAPEVITGDTTVDGRADVYSLGCTLFRLLTGSIPFPGHTTAAAMANAHVTQAAPKPSELLGWAAPELDAVVAKALAKRPADRYATAGELAAAAAHALSPSLPPLPDATPPPTRIQVTPVESARPARPRSKRWMILCGAAAVVVAIVLAWLAFPSHDDNAATTISPSPTPPTSTSASPPRKIALPAGYPPGACTPGDSTDPGTEVVMICGPNKDAGGPVSGTYSLAHDAQSLQGALADVIRTATTVICPGNIQSPGPWRRVADPTTPRGTLFCGIGNDGRPLIAWTLDADRFLAVVESLRLDGAGLNDLYAWWASHS